MDARSAPSPEKQESGVRERSGGGESDVPLLEHPFASPELTGLPMRVP